MLILTSAMSSTLTASPGVRDSVELPTSESTTLSSGMFFLKKDVKVSSLLLALCGLPGCTGAGF